MQWETVIGLEVHVQLNTNSKLFSGAATAYGAEPNTQACAIDLGLPGVLPVLNEAVIDRAIRLGLALDATIAPRSVFARKNYFYPDLPKGYQISQLEDPIVSQGKLDICVEGVNKTINVTRAHLEEDAGKSLHEAVHNMTAIDLNRAGTPLLEVVCEPELSSAKEAVAYLRALHTLVRYIGISDGNMQEGSFRCDANVSIRPRGQAELGTRAEIKNINSFRFVERAIDHEVERQIDLLESGGKVIQETRLYDAIKNETRSMRSKEEANDYRYFPDPDLLPVTIQPEQIEQVRALMPELPWEKQLRFETEFALSSDDSILLSSSRELAAYFEETASKTHASAKVVANWLNGELTARLNTEGIALDECPIRPDRLALLLDRIEDNTISGKIAKTVLDEMWSGEASADTIIEAKGLKQITDNSAIEAIIDDIIANNPGQVEQYRSGKDKVFGFFVGQVMKATQGKANPGQVNQLLKQKL